MSRSHFDGINIPKDGKWAAVLALIAGLAYGILGILQLLSSLAIIVPIVGFSDVVGGFLLIIIAAVFLTGVKPLSKNEQEGFAFIAVGFILAGVLFGLQILVIITDALGWTLGYAGWLNWNVYNDITPSLWMFVMLMATAGFLLILGNLREKLQPRNKEVLTI